MSGKYVANFDAQLLDHIQAGRNDEAKSMLNPDLAKASDDFGTLVHYAVSHDNRDITRYLIELGSDVDSIGNGGHTPLLTAVDRGSREIVGMLLEAGANIDIANNLGKSALQMVFEKIIYQVHGIFQQFIHRVRANASSIEESAAKLVDAGCTICHVVYAEDLQLLKSMQKRGAVDAIIAITYYSSLHTAARVGNVAIIEWLIDNGADINARTEDEDETPLHVAAEYGSKDAVRLLLERGADPNAESHQAGRTPLWAAAITYNRDLEQLGRYTECVELLIEHDAVPRNLNENVLGGGDTIFDAALSLDRWRMTDLFVAHLAMLQRIGTCDAEAVMVCNYEKYRAKLQRVKENYEVCQRVLDVVVFGTSTLFDLLKDKKDFCRIRRFVRNKTFTIKVGNVCSEYKIDDRHGYYYKTLMKHIVKARRIVELEDEAIPVICELFESSYNQCFGFARKVVGYLNERDLEQLILV